MADTRTQCCPMVYVVRWRESAVLLFQFTQQARAEGLTSTERSIGLSI